jgi:hypothetical protein
MTDTASPGWQADTSGHDVFELANENLASGAVDDRPALEVDPGDAGPVQEDDDLADTDPRHEHQGEGDDDE